MAGLLVVVQFIKRDRRVTSRVNNSTKGRQPTALDDHLLSFQVWGSGCLTLTEICDLWTYISGGRSYLDPPESRS